MDEQQKRYFAGILVWSLFTSGVLFIGICLLSRNVDADSIEIGTQPLIGLLLIVNLLLTAFLVRV